MSQGNSRQITTNQTGPHEKIPDLVARHLHYPNRKPYSEHTLMAFAEVQDWLDSWQGPLILDACCGVGQSTALIAEAHQDARVIGVDKSALRTDKHGHYSSDAAQNYLIVRADLNDFWRLALAAGWQLHKHYLLYPNPYPKASQVQRRWHASPAFADIIKLGGLLEVRSNWQLYVQEFAWALDLAGIHTQAKPYQAEQPQTPFERKYWASGQPSWHLLADLNRQRHIAREG